MSYDFAAGGRLPNVNLCLYQLRLNSTCNK